MYSNILNNWFYGEDVQVDDMKLLTKSFLQLCFAANGGNVMATGITPTITGNNIATTKGFVYFGETSDAIFIERTGTNQLISFVDPTSVPLIANGYLYVKPIITYDVNNRTSTVSGVVYTSTNAADEGINLATITNSVITQVNSINPLGATQLQRGITQLATQAEVNAGTVTNKAVVPSTFAASTQLAAKAPLVSPALTGTPTAPTAAVGTNTTQLATTAFVQSHIAPGNYAQLAANNTFTGTNTFSGLTNGSIGALQQITNFGTNVTYGVVSISTNGAQVPHANLTVQGNGDSNGFGVTMTTPNGVSAPNGNSQLGALTMQQRSVANLGISYPNIPGATSYTMGFGWDGSHVRCMVDNNTGVVPVLANLSDVTAQSLGVGQTWQNVTASRAINATYTNTTGKPIMVSVIVFGGAGNDAVYFSINPSIGSALIGYTWIPASSQAVSIQCIVPPSATYRLSSAGYAQLQANSWAELR